MNFKKKSQKQEKDIANKLNGKAVIASGAFWSAKGDVRTNKYLIEAKTTEKSYYPLNAKTWEKISKEAIEDSLRIPVMIIDLNNGRDRIAIVSAYDFGISICETMRSKSIRIRTQSVGKVFCLADKDENYVYCMSFDDFRKEYM